jgi:hypothetical protein
VGGLGVARHPDTSPTFLPSLSAPPDAHLDRAATVLNEGERVVMLTGVGPSMPAPK